MSIYEQMGWFAPAIVMVAQGERSFCNWDEDSLTMAVDACRDCLAGRPKQAVDGLYLGSTTLPFADRSNAGIVKEILNLRDDLHSVDFTSSQRAGTSALLAALAAVQGGERKNVLVAAADSRETKTAYFYEMWFGDGAAALTIGGDEVIAEFLGSYSVSHDFVDHYRGARNQYDYVWEERWAREEGFSKIIPEAVTGLLTKLGLGIKDVDKLVFPCIFKAERKAIAKTLGIDAAKVPDNLHEQCGETGAAHALVLLVQALEQAKPGERIVALGFGQGCDALCFRVTDKLSTLPTKRGIKGSLAAKKTVENYAKFLKFKDLLKTEMGIRAEAPTQTAMTVLWRKRKLLHGLVGGKCRACGTAQLPAMELCINPECLAHDSQDDYEFCDRPATVMSYTGDLLAVSVDPPAVYGMIRFEGGGRMMADFTDCTMDEVRVGQKVRMVYRRRYVDRERGFTGYFWKAVPVAEPAAAKSAAPTEELRFDGKVAVVTGAGAGLGKTYALMLAQRGAKIVVNDLGGSRDGTGTSNSAADAVVAEIVQAGGEAVANYDSVATPEGGAAIVQKALDAFGRIDILINNAGILRDKSLSKLEPADWKAVRQVHLDGTYHATKPAFEAMRAQGFGRIVMTTSSAGLFGNFGQSNYAAAKLGIVGMMNTLELEGVKKDVLINTVAPVAATRLTEDVFPPDLLERSKPELVAALVLFLCSDRCKETGHVFNAGLGFFNRTAMISAPGIVLGGQTKAPTLEDIHRNFGAIDSLEGAKEHENAMVALGAMQAAVEGKGKKEETPGKKEEKTLTVAGIFERMPEAFQKDKAAGVVVTFQFSISGEGGGDWSVVIADQTCSVSVGKPEKPTTTITMASPDFVALIQGTLNPMQAYTSGKLKIGGDLMKSQLIEKLFKY